MKKFLARIALEYSDAQEKLPELGAFWNRLITEIPAENSAQADKLRFTFMTLFISAENREDCVRVINEAWEKAYGSEITASEILVTDYTDGDKISELMEVIYTAYYGVDDYIRLITELTDVINILTKKDALDIVRRQSYLFAVDGGCGFTTLLRSIGDYLHQLNVYTPDQYDKRIYYLEYKLGKETEGNKTSADDILSHLFDKRDELCYNVVGMDISYYLDGRKYDELRDFLNRLEEYGDNYIFAFRIPFLEKKALDEIVDILSDQMMIKVVQVPPLSDSALMENFWNLLTSKDITPKPEVFELISEKIHREKMDGRFYGFKTINKIAREAVLQKALDSAAKSSLGEEPSTDSVTPEELDGFLGAEKQKLTGFEALGELIGMEEISKRVKEIVAQVKVSIANEKLERPCIHMRFTGSPGTGKTTVARIIGQILREEGVLRKGGFFEYEARELVAEYEGQTAVKTASICRDAYGSVLFIDEAYALNEGKTNGADFGKEAIATLVSEMENHRDDMLVVMAGYQDEMDALMKVNPGLRSRMPYILEFPNYTKEQLFDIFMLMVSKHFSYDNQLKTQAHDYFMSLSDSYLESKEFPNARFVRNLYERTWSKGALRCSLAGKTNITLTKEDFVSASSEKEFNEKIETKKKVGFK